VSVGIGVGVGGAVIVNTYADPALSIGPPPKSGSSSSAQRTMVSPEIATELPK
jgi:hypothetical protein